MLTTNAITQEERKFLVSQKALTSIVTETIFQVICHEMTKANDDISFTLRAVQGDSVTLARVSSETQ